MDRVSMINRIGTKYLTTNIENGEYSYVVEAGSKAILQERVGHKIFYRVIVRKTRGKNHQYTKALL